MAKATCSRCNKPVSFLKRDLQTGLCPRCEADAARAGQADLLEGLRESENAIFRMMLSPLPKSWVPPFEQALTHPRFRGLMKLVGGLLTGAVVYLITWGIGALTGYTAVNALIGLPFAVSMIGLMEIVIGINFADLENLFSRGGFLLKIGISIVVLFFVAIYLAGAIWAYRTYYQYY